MCCQVIINSTFLYSLEFIFGYIREFRSLLNIKFASCLVQSLIYIILSGIYKYDTLHLSQKQDIRLSCLNERFYLYRFDVFQVRIDSREVWSRFNSNVIICDRIGKPTNCSLTKF